MSANVDRRTTKETCFLRGSSLYGAGVSLHCAEQLAAKGDFKGARNALDFSAGVRISSIRNNLPKTMGKEATSLLKEISRASKLTESKKVSKAAKVKAIEALNEPWRALTTKVEKLCGAED